VLKYSLGTLLVAVAVTALACAAFVNHSQLWAESMFAVVLTLLSIAAVMALVSRGRARNFACGFAAVGGLYFLLAFLMEPNVRDELLITERAIDWLHAAQQKAKERESPTPQPWYTVEGGGMGMTGGMSASMEGMSGSGDMGSGMYAGMMSMANGSNTTAAPRTLKEIGHCIWAMILGAAGGALGHIVGGRVRREEPTP
jgi:hypothetical protein